MSNSLMSPKGRVSYPNVFQAKTYDEGSAKYELNLLFAKGDKGLNTLAAAATAAVKEKWPNMNPEAVKERVAERFVNGDAKDYNGYAGHIAVRFSSTKPPGIIGPDKSALSESSGEFYPGCFARVTFHAYAWEAHKDGKVVNSGVSFTLHNIQKLADGDRLDNQTSADDDFEAVETSDTVADFAGSDEIAF